MKTKLAIAALSLVVLVVPAAPAAAFTWALGTELGGSIFRPDYPDAEGVATFAWPMVGPSFYQNGGLRVSFMGTKPTHEIWFGTSFSYMLTGGHSTRGVMMSGNYQYNFPAQGRMIPYLTAGVGLNSYGRSEQFASATIVGAGAGLSWRVHEDAGRIRAEVRYDNMSEGKSEGFVTIPRGGSIGMKLGIDLWGR